MLVLILRSVRSSVRPLAALLWLVLLALPILLLLAETVQAAPTAQQRQQIQALRAGIRKAGNFYQQGKFEQAGAAIQQVQQQLEQLGASGDKDVLKLLEPLFASLTRAHALLELEGIQLPPLNKPEPADAGKPASPAASQVSFVKQVAPVLVNKCGRCHISDMKGGFSLASYAILMKGPADGVVVFPEQAEDSRLIEVIESGDMPRGGLKVAPQELAVLKAWIGAGAKFDGDDPEIPLERLAPASVASAAPVVEVMSATGEETVSFAREIAPVLVQNCAGCHGRAQQVRGRLNLLTFQGLLRGGESGAPVLPGQPADSLLLQKLQGTGGGQRMPLNASPLPDAVIAKIETWIQEGARFDGPDAGQDIGQVAALARAQHATHEELSAERGELAVQSWRLGMPNSASAQAETENFLVLGSGGEATLADYAERAEAVVPRVAALFQAPADQPLVKGRITLFFFDQRYDYSEFGKMVERRPLPQTWRGHWRYSVVDAYAAVIPPRNDEYSLEALMGQQIAGVYLASLPGQPPRWFAEGSARAAAARLVSSDARVRGWDEQFSQALETMSKPDDFLAGRLAPEAADVVSYKFAEFLMGRRNTRRYSALLQSLAEGQQFSTAFEEVYGGSPAEVAEVWLRTVKAAPRRR